MPPRSPLDQMSDPKQGFATEETPPMPDVGTFGGLAQRALEQRGPLQIAPDQPPVTAAAPGAGFAKEYPPTGPAVPTWDKIKGKTYPAKDYSPEEADFAKARERVMGEMQADPRWQRYFPTEERFDVDPSLHPEPIQTSAALPKKQETIRQHRADIFTPENRARLTRAFERGQADPSTHNWYSMGQLQDEFSKELGPVEGPRQFRNRFAAAMAATTSGADPTSNLLTATYGNYLRAQGLPFPQGSWAVPYPVGGGKYGVMPNLRAYQQMMGPEGADPQLGLQNPKRTNFAQGFLGDTQAVMDEQMLKGISGDPKLTSPKGDYGIWQDFMSDFAKRMSNRYPGLTPRDIQERAWAGFKGTAGKPMIEHFNEAIERTSRLTGMQPQEIVRGFIRGQIPLYALALAFLVPELSRRRQDDAAR